MTKRMYDSEGRWVELDSRHSIAREFTGTFQSTPNLRPGERWVFRFCGDFVSCHTSKAEAQREALRWEMVRVERMSRT